MKTLGIGDLTAEAGTKTQGSLHVIPLAGNWDARIPTILINGRKDGPIVNLHAGIHGDEFEGIRAIWQIAEQLRPDDLSGAIIATPIVNSAAYAAGMRESAIDGKNLARVFPGDPKGTSSDKLAHFFFQEVILKSDYTLGLHSGGLRYRFHPLVEYYHGVKKDVEERAKAAAEAFAVGPFTVIQRISIPPADVTCTYEASRNGVAAIEPEMWGEGRCLEEHVEQYVSSVMNVLSHLKMIRAQERITPSKVDLAEGRWVLANSGGLFVPSVKIRDNVTEGQKVGAIKDDLGAVIEEVNAPATGFIGALRTFPMIQPGDRAVMVEKKLS